LIVLPLGLVGLLGADNAKEEADAKRIAELIQKLNDPEYQKREAAGEDLKAAGEKALAPLRTALATSGDPEVRLRAQRVIRAILWASRHSKSTGIELVPLGSGEFMMGAAKNESFRRPDEAQHKVRLTRGILIGAYEVTQGQYQKVMKATPSWFAPTGGGKDKIAGTDTAEFPVENVSWFDALEFCNRLSKLDGYEPYYELTSVKRAEETIVAAAVEVKGGSGYRLPTEAEWEYACRARTATPFHFGYVRSGKEANFRVVISGGYGSPDVNVFLDRTAKVGSYKSNDWMLHDMHGNVGEWCWDGYDKDYYANSPPDDPPGPEAGAQRVVRGGSWMVNYGSCRSATRYSLTPDERKDHVGFRVARSP
jgi:formylglycine-generating enzyme required for sulfatase activity